MKQSLHCGAEDPLPAGDPHGHRRLPWRDDHSHPGVPAATHGSAAGVDHEGDEEPEEDVRQHR